MGIRIFLLAVLILASGCAGPLMLDDDGALVVIPHEVGSGGHIIVPVMINGQGPFRFALDTGASISVVFDTTLDTTGLEPLATGKVRVHGMLGSGDFPLAMIARLEVSGESWNVARMAVLPADNLITAEIDGILGVDFLARYAVGVSASEGLVRLYPPQRVSERSYRRWNSIRMRQLRVGPGDVTAYTVDLRIGDVWIPALLDLGAGPNLMNWHAARAIGARPRRSGRRTRLYGAVVNEEVIAELNVVAMNIGGIHWRNRTFLVSKFSIFEVLDLENKPVAIIGPGLFRQRDFVIDFVRNRMLVGAAK